jgi:REP element-mobilizing transposase RayT
MARKPRIDATGVLYHVITRGNNRQVLFRADADRERYLAILADAQRRFAIRIYAYTLMPNHVHLLLELTAGKLAKCCR